MSNCCYQHSLSELELAKLSLERTDDNTKIIVYNGDGALVLAIGNDSLPRALDRGVRHWNGRRFEVVTTTAQAVRLNRRKLWLTIDIDAQMLEALNGIKRRVQQLMMGANGDNDAEVALPVFAHVKSGGRLQRKLRCSCDGELRDPTAADGHREQADDAYEQLAKGDMRVYMVAIDSVWTSGVGGGSMLRCRLLWARGRK